MASDIDFYAVLGVSRTADDVVIRSAFKAMMLKYHPDTNKSADAADRATEINAAWEVLGDPRKRAAYDARQAATRKERRSSDRSSRGEGPSAPPPPPEPDKTASRPDEKSRAGKGRDRAAFIATPLVVPPSPLIILGVFADMLNQPQRSALVIENSGAPVSAQDPVSAHQREDVATLTALAAQGNAAAQNNLGVMYADGTVVARDDAVAVSWYRKAAERGNADAQYNLGLAYNNGQGVSRDTAAAASWYRKAADQGNTYAQWKLGLMYATSTGVEEDKVQAYRWLNLAATEAKGAKTRDRIAADRDIVAARMTPEQIAEARRLAGEWKRSEGRSP